MDLKVQIHICAQGAVQMKPIPVICQIFELPGWFLNVFISYNPLRKKRRSVPTEKTQVHWNVDGSRGFWKENIAWGQTEEKGAVLLVSQRPLLFLAPDSCEGRKTLLLTSRRWRNKTKAKKKTIRQKKPRCCRGPGPMGTSDWCPGTSVISSAYTAYPPAFRPLRPFNKYHWAPAIYMPGNAGHCGWSLWIKGHSALCPSSIPGTTNNSCILGCLSSLRKSYFTKHSPES